MSMIRRMSQRWNERKKSSGSEIKRQKSSPKRHQLIDNPVPESRKVVSRNLFQPTHSTAAQGTDMDRVLYQIPQPTAVDAMTDLIKDHEQGTNFPFVGVVGSEGEAPDARRQRLLAIKPSYNKRDVPEIKILGCPLISREGDFTMDSLMAHAVKNVDPIPTSSGPMPSGIHSPDFSISKPYVHIRQVTVIFTPNVSSSSNYCRFWMNLIDTRLIDSDRGSQTNVVVSNQESVLEMSCDYCVSAADLASFKLSYTLERDIVQPGYQWGTANMYFSITESDLPFQSSKIDSTAVYRMPVTTLLKRETNADISDISFTPADLVKLREMYMRGDVVDVDQPKISRLKTNTYSKSSIRNSKKGEEMVKPVDEEWSFMSGARKPKIDAAEASVDADSVSIVEQDHEAIDRSRRETLKRYQEEQEKMRSDPSSHVADLELAEQTPDHESPEPSSEIQNKLDNFFNEKPKKKFVSFGPSGA